MHIHWAARAAALLALLISALVSASTTSVIADQGNEGLHSTLFFASKANKGSHNPARHWAVLAASSAGYWNYRHQADICHAYHLLLSRGIPAEHIILFMVDDIAYSKYNPMPGELYNRPSGKIWPGGGADSNVYLGCKPDYVGDFVSAEMFLAVITGNKTAVKGKGSERVLESGPDDYVFINIVDHGASGLVSFPNDDLYADALQTALKTMREKKKYKQLVFYLEACESGSMFEKILPNNMDIFVTTAANSSESSWATFCPPNDYVNGTALGTCLGDLYSVNWMADSESEKMDNETLETQFEHVEKSTNLSHVQKFGEESMAKEMVGLFQSDEDMEERSVTNGFTPPSKLTQESPSSSVSSRDVPMISMFYKYLRETSNTSAQREYAEMLMDEIKHRMSADETFEKILHQASFDSHSGQQQPLASSASLVPLHFDCLREANSYVQQVCGKYTDYSLKHVASIVRLCETAEISMKRIKQAITAVCAEAPIFGTTRKSLSNDKAEPQFVAADILALQ